MDPSQAQIQVKEDGDRGDRKDEHVGVLEKIIDLPCLPFGRLFNPYPSFQELRGVCEHPLSDMGIAGEAVHPLPSTFYNLLQSIADLMLLLPMGSALQQMAVRCWGIHFTQADHMFLHRYLKRAFSHCPSLLCALNSE